MVSQVICVVCSVLPQPNTTEITFYKFPKPIEQPNSFKAWKNALIAALSEEKHPCTESVDDSRLCEAYICSRHFTAADFSFDNGKLILVKDAIPTRLTKSQYENGSEEKSISTTKDYEPTAQGNNFASTLTKNFMTTSRNNLRSDMVCTETSRGLTPNASECITAMKINWNDKLFSDIGKTAISVPVTPKRHADLEQKVESFGKIFKRLRNDNLLTESYVDKLKVIFFLFLES